MIKNISIYACVLFLCLILFPVSRSIQPEHYKNIIKVAINAISIILIVACTSAVIRNIKKIEYGNYFILYLMTFIASWLCLFSNSITRIKPSYLNNFNKSIPMSFLVIGSLCTIIIGFLGFRIIRSTQSIDYKIIGYLLSTCILVVCAVVIWLVGPTLLTLFLNGQ